MFFPESIWGIIKEFMLDNTNGRLMQLIEQTIPRLTYRVKLSFYYQAKYQFVDFLNQWFSRNLNIIDNDRSELVRRMENYTQFELWTLNYLDVLKTNLMVKNNIYSQTATKMHIDELIHDIITWFSCDIPQWTKTPVVTFLKYCHQQRINDIETIKVGTHEYVLRGYIDSDFDLFSLTLPLSETILKTRDTITLIYTKDNIEHDFPPLYDKHLFYHLKKYPIPQF